MNFNAPVVTMLYAAICVVMLITLALNIVRLRRRHRISLGLGDGAALEQPVRVHGNFTEYTPTFLILLLLAELGGAAFWFLHLLGAAFVAGVVERSGAEGLARLWEGGPMLPSPPEVDAPGLWLARIDLPDDL